MWKTGGLKGSRIFLDNVRERATKKFYAYQFSSVQLLSRVQLFGTPWTTALQTSLSITNSRSFPSVLFLCILSSVAQSCPTLCNPIDCSTPGFPVHQLPELAQTHVHRVDDAIQPSHPLLSPSPPVFNLSQHQGLFQ